MSKLSFWRAIGLVCVFGALATINSPAQTFTTLVSFDGTNGYAPYGSLIQGLNGNFYGTTYGGATYAVGTVFKVTPTGTLTDIYSFCSQTPSRWSFAHTPAPVPARALSECWRSCRAPLHGPGWPEPPEFSDSPKPGSRWPSSPPSAGSRLGYADGLVLAVCCHHTFLRSACDARPAALSLVVVKAQLLASELFAQDAVLREDTQ